MKNISLFFSFICVLVFARIDNLAEAYTQYRTGLYYKIGEKSATPLFRQETKLEITDDLNRTSFAEIFDAGNKVQLRDIAEVKNGLITIQVLEQLQIQERYELEVKGHSATFKTFSTKESPARLLEQKTIVVGDEFFTGPSLEVFFKKES